MNLKFLGTALAVLAIAGSSAFAHISYSNRNFGTLIISTDASNNTQTVSSGFGWADATDVDWGDSHRGRYFRFTLANPLAGDQGVRITVSRNLLGTGPNGTFLPAFSLFSGLAQRANNEGVQQGSVYRTEALAHDGAALSIQSLVDQFGSVNGSGLGGSGKEGSFRSLGNWSIGNDPTYNTASDPASGILIAARLASFTYIGHAADGTSANFGNAAGIVGDGTADGFVTATFSSLAAGDYSLFVGGANYALQTAEPGPTYPTYGVNVTVGLVPEPSTSSLLLGSAALLGLLRRRKA
jgi:PEP-CTERM motif